MCVVGCDGIVVRGWCGVVREVDEMWSVGSVGVVCVM